MTEFREFQVAASLQHKEPRADSEKHRDRDREHTRQQVGDEMAERKRQRTQQAWTGELIEKAIEYAREQTTARDDRERGGTHRRDRDEGRRSNES